MSIVITGATGHLGRLVVEALLSRGVPAHDIVATGRDTARLSDLAERGVGVQRADYTDPASLREALSGAEKLLLVSSSEVGGRAPQHINVINAAKEAGVKLIAYTSIAHADTSSLVLAEEHRVTEAALADSGIPYVLLRNSWYIENYTDQLAAYLEHGITGAAGDGRVSAATRQDYADAAAAVLVEDGHAGATYELGGTAFTMGELAAAVSAASGKAVRYTDLPEDEFTKILTGAGLPGPYAAILADADTGLSQGFLFVEKSDLERLIGRPATPLADALRKALA